VGQLLIAAAIPLFFILIAIELLIARGRNVSVYRFADAIADLSCGISSRVFHLFDGALILAVYALAHSVAPVPAWPTDAWWTWVVAFIAVDFIYYWWHRMSHEVNVLWAAHVVHHQSEDYNYAVALRQALFTGVTGLPFYLPLALLGVSPLVFATCNALNTLYQFWIHTELVERLPRPLELVFNTPSHHRVHHGINPQYLDRNHAGVFIIWDRIFGTFEPEDEPVVYGLVSPLRSYNPLWANFVHWRAIGELMARCDTVGDKLRALFAGPAWRPASEGGSKVAPPVERTVFTKYDPAPPAGTAGYVGGWFVIVAVVLVALMLTYTTLAMPVLLAASVLLMWALLDWGGLHEAKAWGRPAELARLVVQAAVGGWLLVAADPGVDAAWAWLAIGTAGGGLAWLLVLPAAATAEV